MDNLGIKQGYWLYQLYNGYFTDLTELRVFSSALENIKGNLPKEVHILEIGSGPGIVGQSIKQYFVSKEIPAQLTIIDIEKESLAYNTDEKTVKVYGDNKSLPFPDKSFDIVCARSVIHYEKTEEDVRRVFKEVHRVLKDGGFFMDQAIIFKNDADRKLFKNIHEVLGRSMRLFNSSEYVAILQGIFSSVKVIDNVSSVLQEEREIKKRYPTNDIEKVRKEIISFLQNNTHSEYFFSGATFSWKVPFSLFISQK